MGSIPSKLTKEDIDDLQRSNLSGFSEKTLLKLYDRFRYLDRKENGYITAEEFHLIPELSMNPLADRIIEMFCGPKGRCNFKNYVKTLWAFSPECPTEQRLRFAFKMYDVDGDSKISVGDIEKLLLDVVGDYASKREIKLAAEEKLKECCPDKEFPSLDFEGFSKVMESEAGRKVMPVSFK